MPAMSVAKLLIVDDEAVLMEVLCKTLEGEGYSTTGFKSANEGLSALHDGQFDLLLTDLNMPDMDGITMLRSALEVDRNLVVIVMTGDGTIATAVEAMKAGALDFILKPFKLSAILPVLSRALEVRRLRMENAELVRRVRERTAELEAANRELEAFSSSVSHDLGAPLRGITGFSSILESEYSAQMPVEAQKLLNRVTASARRMGQLIEDLLRFSKLGRQPLSRQPVSTTALVREVLDELLEEQADRQFQIRVNHLPECLADASLLRQVFVNLLSNAIKFTRKKDIPSIEVGCQRQGQVEVFYVRDNGAGFDMNHAEKLFGAFQRLHRTDEFNGTGIGLSIAQRIIARHGGRIWADAEIEKGATFYFSLSSPPPAESRLVLTDADPCSVRISS
jgi:two-component system sensor histidine kinase/response regulator